MSQVKPTPSAPKNSSAFPNAPPPQMEAIVRQAHWKGLLKEVTNPDLIAQLRSGKYFVGELSRRDVAGDVHAIGGHVFLQHHKLPGSTRPEWLYAGSLPRSIPEPPLSGGCGGGPFIPSGQEYLKLSDKDDVVNISEVGKKVLVDINGETKEFDPSQVNRFLLFTEGGNDRVSATVSSPIELMIDGGPGDDAIRASTPAGATLHGQDGNDYLEGGVGDDYLEAEGGNDWLVAHGPDRLRGNGGNNLFTTNGEGRIEAFQPGLDTKEVSASKPSPFDSVA